MGEPILEMLNDTIGTASMEHVEFVAIRATGKGYQKLRNAFPAGQHTVKRRGVPVIVDDGVPSSSFSMRRLDSDE